MRKIIILLLFFILIISGCSEEESSETTEDNKEKPLSEDITEDLVENPELLFEQLEEAERSSVVGEWMAYSKGVYYDNGDFRYPLTPNEILFIDEDKTWTFGDNNGKWELSPIIEDDWNLWGISPYSPKNKITLYGWNDDIASGPVEGDETAQFIWVIYRTGPPFEEAPAQVQMKFGWI